MDPDPLKRSLNMVCRNMGITSIAGIDQLNNYMPMSNGWGWTTIDLSGNQISDISPLVSANIASTYTSIILDNNRITDMSPLTFVARNLVMNISMWSISVRSNQIHTGMGQLLTAVDDLYWIFLVGNIYYANNQSTLRTGTMGPSILCSEFNAYLPPLSNTLILYPWPAVQGVDCF